MKGEPDHPEPEVLPEPKSVTVVCPECSELIRLRDVHTYVLSNHLAVCTAIESLNRNP